MVFVNRRSKHGGRNSFRVIICVTVGALDILCVLIEYSFLGILEC
jgi:hypothetical protein